jgi:hypothetical protein
MVKTYKLAKPANCGWIALPQGPFTLAQAESLRDDMLRAGFFVYVVNVNTI